MLVSVGQQKGGNAWEAEEPDVVNQGPTVMNLMVEDIAPVGSVWRQEDGKLCRVVAYTRDDACWVWVKHANNRSGFSWQVNPAWFETWERTS